jgi:hypothetical protein
MRYARTGETLEPGPIRAQLQEHAARAGLTGAIVTERYLHKMMVAGGMPLASRGGLAGRPGVAVPGQPNAFVAGDWVGGTGLLLDAAFASGVRAGRLATRQSTTIAT